MSFFDYLDIPYSKIGNNIKLSSIDSKQSYSGHNLPEERSSFEDGYKVVSFYIDAESLMRRAYVLRQDGWRRKANIGHYQRMLVKSKITSMRKYLYDKDRVYVNNIIATIDTNKILLFDKNNKQLHIDDDGQITNQDCTRVIPTKIEIQDEANIIGIVDGQHRTYSYHEGDDKYESKIRNLRHIQNLLVTAILFPTREHRDVKMKFEANLFLEINATQTGASSKLKQDIELMIDPFSTISIAKRVLEKLNENGPLQNRMEEYWYEKGKLKTVSIVSYGLKPLVKLDSLTRQDSLFSIWRNPDRNELKNKKKENYELLNEYIDYATEKINEILKAFKTHMSKRNRWSTDRSNPDSALTVTTVNGILNTMRILVEKNQVTNEEKYMQKLNGIEKYEFKQYKSSQYRKMGEDIYEKYFSGTQKHK